MPSKTVQKKKQEQSPSSELKELHFGKKLANLSKEKRDRGVQVVAKWLSKKENLGLNEHLKIWKGLYYCYWLSDKPDVQQDLAIRLSEIMHTIPTASAWNYIAAFFQTMQCEWPLLDRLRLDKYYLLVRKFLNNCLHFIENRSWNSESINKFSEVINSSLFKSETLGVKLHVIEIFLEELSHFKQTLKEAIILEFLNIFSVLLASEGNKTVTTRISKLFQFLLTDLSSNLEENLVFPIKARTVSNYLFEFAISKTTKEKNRKIFYQLSDEFKNLANKLNEPESVISSGSQKKKRKNYESTEKLSNNGMEQPLKKSKNKKNNISSNEDQLEINSSDQTSETNQAEPLELSNQAIQITEKKKKKNKQKQISEEQNEKQTKIQSSGNESQHQKELQSVITNELSPSKRVQFVLEENKYREHGISGPSEVKLEESPSRSILKDKSKKKHSKKAEDFF